MDGNTHGCCPTDKKKASLPATIAKPLLFRGENGMRCRRRGMNCRGEGMDGLERARIARSKRWR
ncbi:hypothetical protein AUN08_00320 [Cronobacter sakazakii]|nr:hypothetical protein [Cronobacter sakazakii]